MIILPEDYKNRIRKQLEEEAEDFLESYNKSSIKSLRVNSRKNSNFQLPFVKNENNDEYLDTISTKAFVKWEKNGIYFADAEDETENEESVKLVEPGKSALHAAGAYYIQEASAMLPVTMLDINDEDHMKILDLCASPGGKSTQIADYMNGKGLLVSNEIVPSRAKILSENIERMGVTNALVISEDPIKLAPRFEHFFDRILVDAPCSGEGMFRKHPEGCTVWSLENVSMCAKRQAYILDCAAQMLEFSGRIVYSTCTFSEEEDENVINDFLDRHPEYQRVGDDSRIFPHKDRGEGHFAAILEYKNKPEFRGFDKKIKKDKTRGQGKPDKRQIDLLLEFVKKYMNSCKVLNIESASIVKNLDKDIENRLLMFGDKIYLCPEYMPDIKGITVLRPGLWLGTIAKDRFEPSHALALALSLDEMRHAVDYDRDSQEIKGYLKGMTINYEGQNGWYLICVNGLSIGWGKCSNNILKNHYPKGLRIMG